MSSKAVPASAHGSTSLAPGQVVGGRFEVERTASEDALGVVLAARDQKTGKPIALRVMAPHLIRHEEAAQALRAECRTAATLTHRNIVGTYGVGTDPNGAYFVACEWIDGVPLSALVAKRKRDHKRLSLRGAYNIVAHVCKALADAHSKMPHGALRPSVVWVSRSGRVKVGDFGVGRAVVRAAGAQGLGAQEQACLAPEVKAGHEPTEGSDIFGVGALLYEMLTGLSPAEGFVPPSQSHPDATEAIDQVLLRCLAADPAQRYESPDEVRTALLPLVADAPDVSPEEDFGVDIDIDVDLASQRPAPPGNGKAASPAAAAAPRPQNGGNAPQAGARVSVDEQFRPNLMDDQPTAPKQTAPVDLQQMLAKITENDAPRWMVVKNNLDHGPFSGRELVELILKGDIIEDHTLLNMDTGERRAVQEWDEFTEFLEQYKIRKQQQEQQAALARSEKVEKRSTVFKVVVAASIFGVLAAGGGIFLLTRQVADESEIADGDLADLYESGEIEISGSAGILPEPKPGRRGRRARARRRGGGGAGGELSYEEAMNRAVEMNAAESGGEKQLSPQTVAGVMNRHVNKFFGCVSQELRGGGSLGKVQIDLAILGSGKVQGASVRQGSGKFQSCIARKVQQVKFPSFSAPRMGARYSFQVD